MSNKSAFSFEIYKFPFGFTTFAIFIPIIVHLLGFEIATFFHFIVFSTTIFFVTRKSRFNAVLFLFVVTWFLILCLHFFFKGDLQVFGYMQSFFYAVCFYALFSSNGRPLSGKTLLQHQYRIYGLLFITLVVEMLANVLRIEHIFVALFSENSVGKSYQILTSRILDMVVGYNLTSLNSIFFGPQSASIVIFMCLLFYNPTDKLGSRKYLLRFLLCVLLFVISNTMTVTILFIIFLLHFIFSSNNSFLNKPLYKITITTILFFTGPAIIAIFFGALQADKYLDIYLYKWTQPVKDLSLLSSKEFWFGISPDSSLSSYTDSWEFGAIQSVYLTGIMPIVFLLILLIYLLVRLIFLRKNAIVYMSENSTLLYQSARLGIFIIGFCFMSLIHYAAIFSTGFFQLIGLHIAIAIYSMDQISNVSHYKS